jgi:tetratricopeptide (TPR) repeat protein
LVVAYSVHGEGLVKRDRAEAEAALRRGLELGPVVDDPEHPGARYQIHWARLHSLLGDVLSNSGRLDEAEQLFRQARQLSEEGLLRKPFRGFVTDLLRNTNRLATFHIDRGETEPARELYRRALRVCTDVVAKNPRDLVLRDSLGWCHHEVGDALARLGETAEADRIYREAIRIAEEVLAERPTETRFMRMLADRYPGPDDYAGQGDHAARLGRWAEAEQAFRKALALSERVAAGDPSEGASRYLAAAYTKLGRFLAGRGRPQEAEALFRQAAAAYREAASRLRIDDLKGHNDLARFLATSPDPELRDPTQAVRLSERALEACQARLGPDHDDTLWGMEGLAGVYQAAGRLAEAVALRQQVLERRRAKLGPDHGGTLNGMNALAVTYIDAGRPEEAIALLESVLAKLRAQSGSEDGIAIVLGNLAEAHHRAGRPHDGIALLGQALEVMKAKHGPNSPEAVQVMHTLAHAYQNAGQLPEAVALFEQSLAKRKSGQSFEKQMSGFGPEAGKTREFMACLAAAYNDAGAFDQAEPLLVDVLEHARKMGGPASPQTADVLAMLGLSRLKQQKYAEAEPVLRECLMIRGKAMADDWLRFNALSMLGGALLGQKKYAEAEPLLLQGYEGMKQREAKIPPPWNVIRLVEAVERIVRLYEATGQADQARTWRAKLPADKPADR